jgi:N-acetylmuramoyl-L-alanine amidase
MNTSHLPTRKRASFFTGSFLRAVLGLALAFPAFLAPAIRADSKADSQKQFERAVKMRTMLEGYLERDRGESDYKQTVLAYRKVYLITPTAPDATQALIAEAELYEAMGRLFDPKYFQEAVDRYNFLLKQYPGTRFRSDTLFAIGKVQKDDLKKPGDAQETFQQFLKHYPHSDKAADAQQALKEIADARQPEPKPEPKSDAKQAAAAATAQNRSAQAETQPKTASKDSGQRAPDVETAVGSKAQVKADIKTDVKADAAAAPKPDAKPQSTADAQDGINTKKRKSDQQVENVSAGQPDLKGQAVEPRVGNRRSDVTRVQTWNSPGSTRVIVTLNDTIKYESARIASPDRIYFNLYKANVGAKLSRQELDVNDGLLESVRVAQNKPDVVRLVLNVNGEKDYSAFLLANPYRLVIDIHSRAVNTAKSSAAPTEPPVSPAATASVSGSSTVPPTMPVIPAPSIAATVPAPEPVAPKTTEKKPEAKSEKKSVASSIAPAVETPAAKPATVTAEEPPTKASASLPTRPDDTPAKVAEKTVLPLSKKAGKTSALLEPPPEPRPTRDGQRSLTRALGLKINRIVIDAGHGGHDTGTIGPHGLMEKDLCLDVAQRLGALIEQKLPGADVVYTRNDDTFVPLEERTAIANRAQADLFISIHANSSHDGSARGVETYYLNFATTEESMEVASRENALSQESLHDLQDIIKKIARNDKIEESKELASDIQDSLTQRLQVVSHSERNRGVKKAPFVVLIGANMPSILSEISFVSNPADEKLLRKTDQRQRIADGLFRGVSSYLESLNSLSNNKQKLLSANPADPGTVASNGNPK